jgi:predicted lipoprotein with Yx(FWY)xxD motif
MGGTSGGGKGGAGAAGGKAGAGGSGTAGTGGVTDACSMTTPLTGGTTRQSSNASGTAAGMSWTIWSNGSGGSITYYDKPAFRATWNNSGDFLARLGLQWNATRTYDTYGTITAQYASMKTGNAGGYSYVGIYGWSVSPCVEYYIVDDSYNRMPVNPGSTTNKGTAMIDGGTYTLYTRNTTGTGGSKCPGTTSWVQYYSVRQTARTCGQISITAHFDAWAAAGMPLGRMDQAQILIEAGGGVGSIDFTYASVTATMP